MANPRTGEPYIIKKRFSLTKKELQTVDNVLRILKFKGGRQRMKDRITLRDLIFSKLLPMWVIQHEDILQRLWAEDQTKNYTQRNKITFPQPR